MVVYFYRFSYSFDDADAGKETPPLQEETYFGEVGASSTCFVVYPVPWLYCSCEILRRKKVLTYNPLIGCLSKKNQRRAKRRVRINMSAEEFDAAAKWVQSLPKDGPAQPTNDEKLITYGLYALQKEKVTL
ncbi:unnamed protein product [Amoebophrya sp. A120]|nr:unnamed protein product [Amoebophrya sp. A120]|eukprot:GSA120T00019511001.1